ncbi:hypothetical protein DUI87_19790 [Hirundo rustica rustica]|uniref:Uncharacterized protein n=1 Tax=Hirundo rustica rustica TaxID=333673 RepID=A0A3M0JSC0_HIRRU|nr:hypothetical protein DUI87_19790 [Hirundo rustica rustica]
MHAWASSGTVVWKGTDSWPCQLTRSCGALDPTRPRWQAQVVQGNDGGDRNVDSAERVTRFNWSLGVGTPDLQQNSDWDLTASAKNLFVKLVRNSDYPNSGSVGDLEWLKDDYGETNPPSDTRNANDSNAVDPELAAKGKPNPFMVLKAKPTHTQKEGPEEMLTEHKETTVAQEMLTKFEKECEKLATAWEMLEKLEAEMRERENLDYWEYRKN